MPYLGVHVHAQRLLVFLLATVLDLEPKYCTEFTHLVPLWVKIVVNDFSFLLDTYRRMQHYTDIQYTYMHSSYQFPQENYIKAL